MKLAVVGSRNFPNKKQVFEELDKIHKDTEITEVVSGGAQGVDTWAEEWSKSRLKKDAKVFLAEWKDLSHPDSRIKINKWNQKYDANAGHRRNTDIVEYSDKVIAFVYNNSGGTMNTVKKAKIQGKILSIIKI